MKLLLDMYKSAPKEQRDKVQLMAAERKSKAEVCSSWHHNFAHFFFRIKHKSLPYLQTSKYFDRNMSSLQYLLPVLSCLGG